MRLTQKGACIDYVMRIGWIVARTQNATGEPVPELGIIRVLNPKTKESVWGLALEQAEPGEVIDVAFDPNAVEEDEDILFLP